MIPEWPNRFNLASWEPWLNFDAIALAPQLERPFLMVHSDAAVIPVGAKRFYAEVKGPKAELWLNDVSQFDFYHADEPIARAADAVAKHFAETLS